MACTTILIGKEAMADGSTFVARNDDSPNGLFRAKNFVVVQPEDQPKTYEAVLSKVKIPLPDKPMRYTSIPNADDVDGIWGCCGFNAANVFMSATETLTTNERVLAADPLVEYQKAEEGQAEVPGGIGEEDMVTLVLPYIHSAREGVKRLGKLLEEYGTYEMNGIAFQDEDEIWWLETVGGHHWYAKRVPDDSYVIMANQLGVCDFDFADALGTGKNHLCHHDLKAWTEKYHLARDQEENFNPRLAYGSHSDADHVYNTPRVWALQNFLNPSLAWEDVPESDDLPWALVPEAKLTVEEAKMALSNHYQGTYYDPYGKGDHEEKHLFRPIAINRNDALGGGHIRPDQPKACQCLVWLAFASNVFNAFIPQYANVNTTPVYFSNATEDRVDTDNFAWANRLIAALCDAHFNDTANLIERYQQSLQAANLRIVHDTDATIADKGLSFEDASPILEEANEKIAQETKKQTDQLLKAVLKTASNGMKNGFNRSDA